jgi:hypothetical protein
MKKIATGIATALLIAATTSLAMAQDGAKRYYNYSNDSSAYTASQQYNTSPASSDSGIEQER